MKGLRKVLADSALLHRRCPRCHVRLPEHMRWCSWPAFAQEPEIAPADPGHFPQQESATGRRSRPDNVASVGGDHSEVDA